MVKKLKQTSKTPDKPRFTVSLEPEVKADYDQLCSIRRRSVSAQTELLIEADVKMAKESGELPTGQPDDIKTEAIGYDAALTICKAHAVDDVVKLKAVAATAKALKLDAEELLAQCHKAGLRTINGNGNKAKVEVTA